MNITARQLWYVNAVFALIILWLVYAIWFIPRKDAWQFIPDNAFLVIESSEIQASLFQTKDTTASVLGEIPFLYDAVSRLKEITQDLETKKELKPFLEKKLISYSVHREAKKNLEFITYIPLADDDKFLNAILVNNAATKRIVKQTTEGIEITKIKLAPDGSEVFSFFVHDDFMVCSRSVILLEAVIAKIKSRSPALDKTPFKESRQQVAHLYFRTRNLLDVADLLPTQLSPNLRSYFRNIMPFNPDFVIDNRSTDGKIMGYISSNTKIEVPFVSAFSSQKPSPFTATSWIPENTAFFLRTSFHDAPSLGLQLNVYLREKDKELYSQKEALNKLLGKDLDAIFRGLSKEAMLCEMETVGDENAQRIALFHSDDVAALGNTIDDLAQTADKYNGNNVKPFSAFNRVIKKIEISELPSLLFGSSFSGFPECYYTAWSNYLVVANTQTAMENYLSQLSLGKTWKTSKKHLDLQRELSKNAQITAVINPQRIWNNIYYSLPENWQQSVRKHEGRFKDMRLLAIENFAFKDQFGTKVHILKSGFGKQRFANQLLLQNKISLLSAVRGVPRVITNSVTKTDEVLVQTIEGISLYDDKNKKINDVSILSELNSANRAIDFYKNGQVQYLAYSEKDLYILERRKEGVNAQRIDIPITESIASVAAASGILYIADASGVIFKVTSGNTPTRISLKQPLGRIVEIAVVKQGSQEFLAVLGTNGTLHLFYLNNGVSANGFPMVALENRPVKLLTETTASGDVTFKIISETGAIQTVSLTGDIQTSGAIQLVRRSKNALFGVLQNQQQTDWLLLQTDPSGVIVYNRRGEQLLEIDAVFYGNLNVKFFDLGNDLRLIAIFDGKTTVLYDLEGHQIGDKPLQSTAMPTITFEENFNKLLIFNPNGTALEKWGVKVE